MGFDSFYVRVNLNIEPHDEPQSLRVSCDDIIHVTDTRYNGKYHWRCSVVDQHTAEPLQTGTMPNYNRFAQYICKNSGVLPTTLFQMEIAVACFLALKWCVWYVAFKSRSLHYVCTIHLDRLAFLRAQQLLLVRLQKMALEQKDFKKKVGRLLLLKHMSVSGNEHCCTSLFLCSF